MREIIKLSEKEEKGEVKDPEILGR